MDLDDSTILDTVMEVVKRYGMKRTTMAEIAKGAGVSRQTLYDRFGDKDDIMAAAIGHWSAQLHAALVQGFARAETLNEKIDAYFDIAVWPYYEALQSMPDAADLERGQGPASQAASTRAIAQKEALLAEVFGPYLPDGGPTAADTAAFFVKSSHAAKSSETSREALAAFLAVLKASILALAA